MWLIYYVQHRRALVCIDKSIRKLNYVSIVQRSAILPFLEPAAELRSQQIPGVRFFGKVPAAGRLPAEVAPTAYTAGLTPSSAPKPASVGGGKNRIRGCPRYPAGR